MTSTSEEQHRSEFEKFSKFFTIRLIQAVVQSRLGQPLRTQCSVVSDGSDWFNVRIEELGEVTSEIRSATGGRFPPLVSSLCLDFQVRTSDGDMLHLESWCVSFDPTHCDPSVSVRTTLYHQMSTLLKSCLSASRMTPTYRMYARKQGADSFIICYQIYEGQSALNLLGEGRRSIKLGHLCSPFGTLSLDLHYRTKMVISSEKMGESAENELKISPPKPVNQNLNPNLNVVHPPMEASPPDDCYSTFSTSPDLGWGMGYSPAKSRGSVGFDESATELMKRTSSSNSTTMFRMDLSDGSSPKPHSLPENSPLRQRKMSFPFEALLSASSAPAINPDENAKSSQSVTETLRPENSNSEAEKSKMEETIGAKEEQGLKDNIPDDLDSSDDGFVKVPLNVFVDVDEANSDLGLFMRECKTAPPQLRSFEYPAIPDTAQAASADPSTLNSLTFLSGQLKEFEQQSSLFDNFLESLTVEDEEEN